MEEEQTETKSVMEKLEEQTNSLLEKITNESVSSSNLETLYKIVDIQKDIEQIKQLKEGNDMRYNDYEDYGNYGARGVPGTGRYRGNYGRRGVPGSGRGRYRGEEAIDNMAYHYGNYHESGNYGAKEDSAYKMTEAFKEFGYAIAEELEPNEKQMFKQAMQEIMQQLD